MNGPYQLRRPRFSTAFGSRPTYFAALLTAPLIGLALLTFEGGCTAKSAGDEQAGSAGADKKNAAAANDATKTHHTLALSTEFLPYPKLRGAITGQLVREIGRQAILIAARDELGVATRDETLSELESLPADDGVL